ncbi:MULTISPECIES: glycoside hydrolase family protein [Pseudoalteromonas]|uniref:glycoside hydrolase family protein n=1 Tax=Pseudoalteromonas TaxID=53246 RepID=UPI001B3918D4|nr:MULTISPECIES: glycoside hydrolase family protein [Pseudoalteromonas]MBQ4838852.1 glycoside hydrolase family protein [Pseudoalteromonas luteoviolacea]MCG7548593.1 glycoside hydrolase family protein [Pseudoalteromonas sp. Of7M-16]
MEQDAFSIVKSQLKIHEGCDLNMYKCTAGKWTIGFGRNLQDRGIDKEEAELMLCNDIKKTYTSLTKNLHFFDSLCETRKAVLINMAFNLGVNGLLGFKKMIAALANQDYTKASIEMLDSRWARQVKGRAVELAELMRGSHSTI